MELQGLKGIVKIAPIEYSVGTMPLSKPKSKSSLVKRKQKQQALYDKNYHIKRIYHQDKDTRILKSHCDLCKEELPKQADNIQYRYCYRCVVLTISVT